MKKNKNLTLGMMTGFVGLLTLASCSGSVTYKENVVMTFKDYSGNEVAVYSDNIFNKYAKTSSGISKYYDAVLETLIRYQYQNSKFSGYAGGTATIKLAKTYDTIKQEALDEVKAQKKLAEQNAKTNGTSYATEWQKILDEKKVEDEDELREYFIYQYEKEEMTDWYYKKYTKKSDTNAGSYTLLQEYLGVDNDYNQVKSTENVNSLYPYHMRHILVKTSGSKSNYTRDVITSTEATHLSDAIKYLTSATDTGARRYNFGDVAYMSINEDTSKDNYGDLGIVNTQTSFVNEFKLGIYAYDAILSGVNTKSVGSNDYIYKGLGLEGTIKNSTDTLSGKTVSENIGKVTTIGKVPVGAFLEIGKVFDKEKDDQGHQVNEGKDIFFPRNILWNEYLNIHHPFVITKEDLPLNQAKEKTSTHGINVEGLAGFEKRTINGEDLEVLVDEKGNTVVGVRSEYGIHFMIMERSIFKNTNSVVSEAKTNLGLEKYYNSDVDAAMDDKLINYVTAIKKNDTLANYRTRANAVKDAVKGFDKTYDYRLYFALKTDNVTIKFNEKLNVESDINKYINMQKDANTTSADESLNTSWRTYLEMLELEQGERTTPYGPVDETDPSKGYQGKMIQDTCRQEFGKANDEYKKDFEKGGKCYYGK